jgi:hypothetical protein
MLIQEDYSDRFSSDKNIYTTLVRIRKTNEFKINFYNKFNVTFISSLL